MPRTSKISPSVRDAMISPARQLPARGQAVHDRTRTLGRLVALPIAYDAAVQPALVEREALLARIQP